MPIWIAWQVATILGVIAGASVPHAWKLEFAAPLAFIATSIPLLRDRAMVAAALAAGATVVLAHPLPMRLGLVLPDRCQLSPLLRRALRYVPAAVLTAIYAPELLVQSGAIDISFENARLLAGQVAIIVAWRLRQALFTIVAGMLALHLFGAIPGWLF